MTHPDPRGDASYPAPYAGPPPTADPYRGAPAYPAAPYPPGPYPSAPYPPAPYAGCAYPGQYGYAPYSGARVGPRRPGQATAAGVLAWICSGLLVIASILLFAGASVLDEFNSATNGRSGQYTGEFVADALLNLLAAGLLIGGGVALVGRKGLGRPVLTAGAVIVFGLSFYWLTRWTQIVGHAGFIFWSTVFAALSVVGACLAWTARVTRWLTEEQPAG